MGAGDYERLKAWARAMIFGVKIVRMIALPDLIAAKEASARGWWQKEPKVIALLQQESREKAPPLES